jgi:hypothetical protein
MATQNWDDHDRSGKYTAIALAKNYLNSCDKNAILFTIGDNDTFPLWYAQEIENIRTDVKIVNTSLFATDWYIDQMKSKTYQSDGLPISFSHDQYVGDKLDYVFYKPLTDSRWDINAFLKFIKDPETIEDFQENGQKLHFFPTNKIRLIIDKENIIKNKVVNSKFYDSIVPYIDIKIKGSGIYKNSLMMLDILANNNWKRPIYFSPGSSGDADYIWMKDYLQLDGMVYKLVPIKTPIAKDASLHDMGCVDSDVMYDLVKKWDWGNSNSSKIYHDPETRRNSISYRTNLSRLMEQLIKEKKFAKAEEIIELGMEKMPLKYYDYYIMVEPFARGYYAIGKKEKARKLLSELSLKYQEQLKYYSNYKPSELGPVAREVVTNIERYRSLLEVMKESNDLEFYNENRKVFNMYNHIFKLFDRDDE